MHVNRRFFCCQEGCMNKNIVDKFSILLNDKHISDIRIVKVIVDVAAKAELPLCCGNLVQDYKKNK